MSRDNRPHRTFDHLRVEELESRVNPADFWWNPTSGDSAGTATNWMKAPDTPWDRWAVAPGPQDDLYFRGDVSTANCIIPAQPSPPSPAYPYAFHGVHLQFELVTVIVPIFGPPPPPPTPKAYTGTVTTSGSFAVGTLEVDCGQISQGSSTVPAGNGSTLTVVSTLDWTGGTLNSNTLAGTIALAPGATGIAEPSFTNPGINGTVALGSTLELQGTPAEPGPNPTPGVGSSLVAYSGTYNITTGVGIVAGAMSSLTLKVIAPKGNLVLDKVVQGKPGSVVYIKNGATATVTCVRPEGNTAAATVLVRAADGEVEFKNEGTTSINNRTQLQLGLDEASELSGYFQNQDGEGVPVTNLQAGSAIVCVDKASVTTNAGTLKISNLTNAAGEPVPDQPEAQIFTSELFVFGGLGRTGVKIGADATLDLRDTEFNALSVRGEFILSGTAKLNLSRFDDSADKILVTQTAYLAESLTKFELSWAVDAVGPSDLEVDDHWVLIESINGIVGGPHSVAYPEHQDAVFSNDLRDFSCTFVVYVATIL